MKFVIASFLLSLTLLSSCYSKNGDKLSDKNLIDTLLTVEKKKQAVRPVLPEDLVIKKEFLYDKYALDDTYPYKQTTRVFQWDKIKKGLAMIETIQLEPVSWAILQNHSNIHGKPQATKIHSTNDYNQMTDSFGVEASQAIPMFSLNDTIVPERYGIDGALVEIIEDGINLMKVFDVYLNETWYIPKKYIKPIDIDKFNKTIFVDRANQNIMTLEKKDTVWLVRSMNPATTGLHKPPYQHPTPLGIFVIQEKKDKMIYPKDGTTEVGGFSPYASRFCDGAYIHGVPVNLPNTEMIEFSSTLGTTPHSHMCVRNATSHAEFVYHWAPVNQSLVFVIE